MSSSSGSGGYNQRPSRLYRVDLGADDDDLDYSEQAGPSNPSRHMASRPPLPPFSRHDPRSSRPYHDLDSPRHLQPSQQPQALHRNDPRHPLSSALTAPPRRTPSPEPDQDVLAYIRAQALEASTSNSDLRLAEKLKKDKFQHGAGKVESRVQKEREAEERKKKQAEEDAAKAYDEFLLAMQGDVDDDCGNEARPQKKAMGFVAAGGKAAYVGPRAETSPAAKSSEDVRKQQESANGSKAPLKRVSTAFGDDESDGEAASTSTPQKEPQRKRHAAMSSFLQELQTEQAERESRLSSLASTTNTSISTLLAHETLSRPGSRDHISDPLTTNICIVSLPPNVDERSVGEFFRAFGDVATVKIMWPRGEQRVRVGGLTGFVAYMTRSEAEYAFREADGAMWGETRLKLSWGKAMPLPTRAMYPKSQEKKKRGRSAKDKQDEKRSKDGVPRLIIRHRRGVSKDEKKDELGWRVEREYSKTQRLFIETVASRIKSNGAHFEQILREREADNPKFAFLHQEDSISYHYYRLCLDPDYYPLIFDPEDEEFDDKGGFELYSTDSGEESETEHLRNLRPSNNTTTTASNSSTLLGPLARRRFMCMLRSMTLCRERIARVTSFALDHASSYPTIVSLLTTSILQPSTPIPRKLARLYALSDLLHNSGTPISNAWRYRAAIEAQLPLIFAHLGMVAKSFTGRLKREEFRGKVLGVVEVWEGWIVVGPHVLERVRRLFDNPPVLPTLRQGDEDVDGEALVTSARPVDAQTTELKDTMDEDVDGDALESTTAGPSTHEKERPVQEEDLDGEALDDSAPQVLTYNRTR